MILPAAAIYRRQAQRFRAIRNDLCVYAFNESAFTNSFWLGAGALSSWSYPLANQQTDEVSIVDLIPALRAFARTFCRVPEDADDLVQETLIKGLANIDKFEPGTRMKSWLFTIMRNTYYTRIKAAVREGPGLLDCASQRPISEATQEWSVQSREV